MLSHVLKLRDFLMQSKNESQRKKERKSGGWGGKGQRAEERRGEGGETGKVEREEWKPLFYQRQNENILT